MPIYAQLNADLHSINKFDVNIDDIYFDTKSSFINLLVMTNTTGSALSDRIILDNLKGVATRNLVTTPITNGETYANTPMRLPTLSGKLTFKTIATTSQVTSIVTLPFFYPRNPMIQLTARAVNGVSATDIAGQPTYTVIPVQATANRVQARMNVPSAFVAGVDVEVIYTVCIKEC